MNYFTPTTLDSQKLEATADQFAAWLKGSSDNLLSLLEQMPLESLKAAADEAKGKLSDPASGADERQRATFACAIFRDASFSFARRGALLRSAASGRFGELLEAATFSKLHLENS